MNTSNLIQKALRSALADISVELGDEFDRNFEREAFFTERWQRRKSPVNSRYKILSGPQQALRQSLLRRVSDSGVRFSSPLPYAAIHNDGGSITVTPRMRRYFWYRYIAASRSMQRRKNGAMRQTKANARLSDEAAFWYRMALKRKGSVIRIPRRQFLGIHPRVEEAVARIVEKHFGHTIEKAITQQPQNNPAQ